MFNQLIIKWIAAAIMAAAISAGLYAGYSHIKQIGYNEATVVYEERLKQYNDRLDTHIKVLETTSTTLAESNTKFAAKVSKDVQGILAAFKGQPPYVIVDGKCAPSPAFTEAYNKVIRKANE